MTERQIENLKKLLMNSKVTEDTPELDDKILTAAKQHAKNLTRQSNWSLLQFGTLSSVTLSIAFTVTLFFGLNQILNINAPSEIQAQHNAEVNVALLANKQKATQPSASVITHPNELIKKLGVVSAPEAQPVRDQILAQLELPNTQDILATMSFQLQEDHKLAENSINFAMSDIRQLISGGQLDKARVRYAQLREMCDGCTLPNTLEALVINAHQNLMNNPIFNSS